MKIYRDVTSHIKFTLERVIIFMISSDQEIWKNFHHWGQTEVNAIITFTVENLAYATKSCVKKRNEALGDKVQLYYSNLPNRELELILIIWVINGILSILFGQ